MVRVSGGSRKQVVELLREKGPLTRADLARLSGLSRSMVSTIVGELISEGLAVEGDEASGRRHQVGRPGVLVSLNPEAGVVVGVDVGHRRVLVAVANLSHEVLAEVGRDLPLDHGPSTTLDLVAELVREVLEEAGVRWGSVVGVGVGLPAPFEAGTGRIHPSSLAPSWGEVRPVEELRRRLRLPVYVENDANLAALAELVWGAGRGSRDAACVVVSDGIGAGLIVDGRLYRGAMGTAGEIGHTVMDEYGPICRCGNRGCLEMLAGVPAVLELLRPSRGPDLTVGRMLRLAAEGDAACRRAIEDAGRLIGIAVANLCNLFNPERVIINGELSGAGEVLLGPLRASLGRCALPVAATAEVVPGQLGARATVLGGVALVLRETDSFVAPPRGGKPKGVTERTTKGEANR
ncbi:ROK family protein [Rubrobacter xylanophilus]|uniref:ROK family protein n=1 Tax=Rubrobacter xylanophilus TaxID=49319 RepID=UPI00117A843E|nr:ROK family transcriptional regulator [Rubrobacter xylanophilus]